MHQLFKEKKNSLFFQVRYPMFDLSYCNIYITMLSTYKAKKNEVLKKSIQTLFNSLLPFSRSVLNHITFVDIAPYFKKKFKFFLIIIQWKENRMKIIYNTIQLSALRPAKITQMQHPHLS